MNLISFIWLLARLAFWLGVPVFLLSQPANYFDGGRAVCLSVLLFDSPCPACGLTRACMRLIHFDFEGAYYFNRLAFIAMPILAYLWVRWFLADARRFRSLVLR